MRRSAVLFQQHAGKMFLWHWQGKRNRVVRETQALSVLRQRGIPIEDPLELVNEKPKEKIKLELKGFKPEVVVRDSTHPDYHEEPCLRFGDGHVLVEGLDQAKALTNTVEVSHLPESLSSLSTESVALQDQLARRAIKSSLLYDAYQEKLPKRKDPEREAWNFPRYYGIVDRRRNLLLCNRLLQLCSMLNPDLCTKRQLLHDAYFKVPVSLHGSQILFDLRADILICSGFGIKPLAPSNNAQGAQLPDLYPLLPTVSIQPERIYKLEEIFPINEDSQYPSIHTAIVHYNETEVANIYETEVTESQILGRSLLKAYTFAMAQARKETGGKKEDLARPVVVQCVHTDSHFFHFSLLQLNSTDPESEKRNIFWSLPLMRLYESCGYVDGVPKLVGYNSDIFKWLLTFYKNS